MTALEIFRIVAPEFKSIPDDDEYDESGNIETVGVTSYMDLFKDLISKKRYASTYDKALAYLTAHNMKMQGLGDNSSMGTIGDSLRVGSFSEGETSISFTSNQGTNLQVDAEYALTVYGLKFLELKRNALVPIISAGEAH